MFVCVWGRWKQMELLSDRLVSSSLHLTYTIQFKIIFHFLSHVDNQIRFFFFHIQKEIYHSLAGKWRHILSTLLKSPIEL